MSIPIETMRSKFWNEIEQNNLQGLFDYSQKKFLPAIDNLYYSCFINEQNYNQVEALLELLQTLKLKANETRESVQYNDEVLLTLKSYSLYRYCLSNPDLYDIFIAETLPNENTPRIVIQIRAYALWTLGIEEAAKMAYYSAEKILADYNLRIEKCRENRIDFCYHTNFFKSPNKIFKQDKNGLVKNCHSNLNSGVIHADLEQVDEGTIFHNNYLCFGSKQSNNLRARVYDKIKEVVELGYKDFFINYWFKNKMISGYDKYCIEYAFIRKNCQYIEEAKLKFYLENGTNTELKAKIKEALDNPRTTFKEKKTLASFMPPVTRIINIEYETKRKFYYYSDEFINNLSLLELNLPHPLKRIFKILDNKKIFLDYLTRSTLAFYKKDGDEKKYLPWWERLRNTKVSGLKADEKLVREYSFLMSRKIIQRKIINAVGTAAVYDDNLETTFVKDVSDWLSNINDNMHQKVKLFFLKSNGQEDHDFSSPLLTDYLEHKRKVEQRVKNRKRKRVET